MEAVVGHWRISITGSAGLQRPGVSEAELLCRRQRCAIALDDGQGNPIATVLLVDFARIVSGCLLGREANVEDRCFAGAAAAPKPRQRGDGRPRS